MVLNYPTDSFEQATHAQISWQSGRFLVSVIHENSPAARGTACFDVAAAVTHHNTIAKVDAMSLRGTQ